MRFTIARAAVGTSDLTRMGPSTSGPARTSTMLLVACVLLAGCRTSSRGDCGPHWPDSPGEAHDAGRSSLEDLGLVYDDTIVTTSARTVDFNGQAFSPRFVHVEKSGGGADLTVDSVLTRAVFGVNEERVAADIRHMERAHDNHLDADASDRNWEWTGACYFAFTVATTIGYGAYAPTSTAGKAFLTVYSIFSVRLRLFTPLCTPPFTPRALP